MDLISLLDTFIAEHFWLAPIGTGLLVFWIWLRYRLRNAFHHMSTGTYQVANLVQGIICLFAILSLLNLFVFAVGMERMDDLTDTLKFWAYLLFHLVIAFMAARALELVWISKSNFVTEGYVPGLPRVLLYGVAFLLGLSAFASANGLWTSGVFISTGALAAVIAFAMQQTLGDFFSGISLSVEHPFKIGDWLELEDGTQGQVRDVNWRATRLRAWDNSTLIIPNGVLARQTFRNLHGPDHRYSPWYTVTLPAEIDPRLAKALLLDVALNCKKVLQDPLPSVRLADSTTVPYRYMVWLHYKDFPSMFAGREEFFRNMHYALREAGIQTAPEIQEVRFQRTEKTEVKHPSVRHMLQSLDFTSAFDEEEKETLLNRSYAETIDMGSVLLAEGETSSSVDIIWNGLIETSVVDEHGKTRTLGTLSTGEYFGLASMVLDIPSFQTFTALTDVTLLRIDRKCFKELASTRDELLLELSEIVYHRMAKAEQVKKTPHQPDGPRTIRNMLRQVENFVGKTRLR
ncbi:MAG: mechanosensitive ion channel family protein [Pseudomonadota bacterium]